MRCTSISYIVILAFTLEQRNHWQRTYETFDGSYHFHYKYSHEDKHYIVYYSLMLCLESTTNRFLKSVFNSIKPFIWKKGEDISFLQMASSTQKL